MNEELKVIISAEITKLKQGVSEAKKQISNLQSEANKVKDSLGKAWNTVGQGATKASQTIATGVAGIATALTGTSALTAEYREAIAKLTTAFEANGASAEVAKETYNGLYRVLGDSDVAVEASNHLAMLTTEEKALNEWTTICQGVFATFGDSLPIESLTEAANETAKVGDLTGVLADALNWAGVNEEEFQAKLDACNDEAEREALIRKELSGLYQDATRKYEETAKNTLKQNEAQAELTETMAELGEAMSPVLTAFTNFANKALKAVTPYVKDLSEKYVPKLEKALDTVGDALAPVAEFISKYLPQIATIAGTLLAIATAYNAVNAALTAYNVVKNTYTTVTKLATTAQTAFVAINTASLAPIAGVVAGITALIAIIVALVKNWDTVSETVKKVWETVKTATSDAVNKVTSLFGSMKTGIANKLNGIKSTVDSILGSISNKFTSVFDGVKNTVQNAVNKIKSIFNFKWELPKIKLPHFSISGKFSLNPPSIPKFSVQWYKLGGVFDSPHLFGYGNGQIGGLGEAGAEAIVPLEKNTKWMNVLAEKLSSKMGGSNQPIILQVDGKAFAEIAVDSINDLTRQRGSLPLRIV